VPLAPLTTVWDLAVRTMPSLRGAQIMPTTIAEQVSHLAETPAAGPPNEIMGAFAREQADLAGRGLPAGIVEVGATLPDAELLDVHGAPTSLYAPLGGRLSVLVFYRGAWCPYCNIALNTYQAELVPELTGRRVGLVTISPQTPDGSLSTQEKHELTFTVLSDPGNQVAKAIGILTAPSDEARAAQLQLGLDLTAVNADGTTGLPMPTTIIVDADHLIRWIDVHPDYSTRSEPDQILAAVDALGAR
jgi:peroxiredoxin